MESQKKQITEIKQELEKQSSVDTLQEKQITHLEKELEKQKEKTHFAINVSLKAIKALQNETKKQIGTALIAAFGFLIALVWKDTITSYTSYIVSFLKFPSPESFQMFYVSILTSIIAVFGIIFVNSWMPKQEDLLKNKLLT